MKNLFFAFSSICLLALSFAACKKEKEEVLPGLSNFSIAVNGTAIKANDISYYRCNNQTNIFVLVMKDGSSLSVDLENVGTPQDVPFLPQFNQTLEQLSNPYYFLFYTDASGVVYIVQEAGNITVKEVSTAGMEVTFNNSEGQGYKITGSFKADAN
jgi:hypothetical protein